MCFNALLRTKEENVGDGTSYFSFKGMQKTQRKNTGHFFVDQNQSKIRRPSPSVTLRAKKNFFAKRPFNGSTSHKQPPVVLSYMQLEFSLYEDGNTRTPLSVFFLENMSGRGLTSAGNNKEEIRN